MRTLHVTAARRPAPTDDVAARALTVAQRVAFGVLGDRETARDVAQEVALVAVRRRGSLRDPRARRRDRRADPAAAGAVFDPTTAEVLEWALEPRGGADPWSPHNVETVLETGWARRIGERP